MGQHKETYKTKGSLRSGLAIVNGIVYYVTEVSYPDHVYITRYYIEQLHVCSLLVAEVGL